MTAPMTSDSTQDAARAHGSSLQRLVSRWPQWKRERHRKYMAEWRKDSTHHAAQLASLKRHRERFGKLQHKNYVAAHGASRSTVASRESEKKATMARQPWGEIEDAMLVSGMTEGELVLALGRSIRAIQRRRRRLRDYEAANKEFANQPPR